MSRSQLFAPIAALQLLTVLPLRFQPPSARSFAASVAYFPAVGALLGLAAGGLDRLLEPFFATAVRSALDLAFLALATGGLHLDGLADTADGLFASAPRERRLALMREPTVGSFGVAALVLVLLVEWSALSQVAEPTRLAALVAGAALARWSMAALLSQPNARTDSVAGAFGVSWRSAALLVATVTVVVVCVLVRAPLAPVLALVALVTIAMGAIARASLGGVTGDVCGAAGELAMAASLLAFAAAG